MDTKEKILSESFLLFLDKGFNNVSMSDISKKSGVGTGTVYYYFRNKKEVITEIVEKFFFDSAYKRLEKAKKFKGTFKERIDYLFYLTVTFQPSSLDSKELDKKLKNSYDRRDLNIFLIEVMKYYEAIDRKNHKFHIELKQLYINIIEDGKANNEIKDYDTDCLLKIISNIIYGSYYFSIIVPEENTVDRINVSFEFLWNFIKTE